MPLLLLVCDERPRPLVPYAWSWSLQPSVLLGTGLLGALYVWGIVPLRRRWERAPVPAWRVACLAGGLVVLLLSLDGPLHHLGRHHLFSAHMLQHLLLTLVLPPLLIAGTPGWLLSPLLRRPAVRAAARTLTRPPVAALLYVATIAIWHLPGPYDLTMRSHELHAAARLMSVAAAIIMWWPLMSPVPELPRLGPGRGMLYLLLIAIPMQLIGAMITVSDEVLYPWYAAAPRTFGLSPMEDQLFGGLLLWVPGNLWMFLAIGVLFFRWARESG